MTTIVALSLMLHGLVHGILALVPNPDAPDEGFASFFSGGKGSWLLTRLGLSRSTNRTIAIILAAVTTIGFIATGLALFDILVPFDWWSGLATGSAVLSLLLLVIFWQRYAIVGIVIDVLILATLTFTNWTPE